MQLTSLVATILILVPVFSPPATGWVTMPPDPSHPNIQRWELPNQGQRFVLSITPAKVTTEIWRATLEKTFSSGSIPMKIVSQGKQPLCNGLTADRLTTVSTTGLATYNEKVFIVYNGKLYDLTYVHVNEQPLAEAETALQTMCPIAA